MIRCYLNADVHTRILTFIKSTCRDVCSLPYIHQSGSGLNYYQDTTLWRSYKYGELLLTPFRAAVPFFKWGPKAIGKQLFHSGVNDKNDLSKGENIKLFTERRLQETRLFLTGKSDSKLKTKTGMVRHHKKRKLSNKTVIYFKA